LLKSDVEIHILGSDLLELFENNMHVIFEIMVQLSWQW